MFKCLPMIKFFKRFFFFEDFFSLGKFSGKILFFFFLVFLFFERALAGEMTDIWKNNQAVDQLKQKKFLEAHEKFSHLLGENSFHPVFQFNLGSSFIGLGDFERAVKMYRETLKLNPLHPKVEFTVLYNLGVLYSQLIAEDPANLEKALHYYQKALEFKPDSKEIKTNIELLLREFQKNKESSNTCQNEGQNPGDKQKKEFTNKPKQEESQKYKNKKLSKKDVENILNELKNRNKISGQNTKGKIGGKQVVEKNGRKEQVFKNHCSPSLYFSHSSALG